MKRLPFVIADIWRPALIGTIITLAVVALYTYKLATLVGGLDTVEFANWQHIVLKSLHPVDIARNATWLPHTLWLYILQLLHISGSFAVYALRGFSVALALLATGSFYILLRRWYSLRLALMGTILLAGSSWMLHVGRYASQEVLYLLPLVTIAAWSQVQASHYRAVSVSVTFISAIFCLYIPGLMWVIVPALFWQRKVLRKALRSISPGVAISVMVLSVFLVIPFVVSLVWPAAGISNLQVAKAFAGIPATLPTFSQFLQNIESIPKSLFLATNGNAALFTGHIPVLGAFGSVMFILGLYDFIRHSIHLDRTKIVVLYILLGIALIGVTGISAFTVLIPVVFLTIANGMRFMLQEWLSVFPRNPVARGVGIGIVTFAVALSVSYHLMTYYVAWPNAQATKALFTYKI